MRLTNDGLWELNTDPVNVHIKDGWLIDNGVAGGFSDGVYSLLIKDKSLVVKIAQIILNKHFPETIHEDLRLRKYV